MCRTHLAWVVVAIGLTACNGGGNNAPDTGLRDCCSEAAVDGGSDGGIAQTLPACEDTEPPGLESLAPVASTLAGTVEPSKSRVGAADPGFNPATEEGEMHYASMAMDRYGRGDGMDRVQRTDLGGGTDFAEDRRSIAWFVHLADFQLADDESPARFAGSDNIELPSGLRAQEAYVPRGISAMSRTLARIEREERPYDFGLISGDCADSAQYNELRWVIDVMDGVPGLHADSGEDDDPVPGPGNDPKDPFDPVPFPAPWLYVPGNHDVEVVGVFAVDEGENRRATGTRAAFGTRDYRMWWAPVVNGTVPPDPDRRLLSRAGIVAELFETAETPGPAGHGYPAPDADTSLGAHYVYDAVPGVLRILALDSTDISGGSKGLVKRATVDGWLVPELERAADDGVLVMLASHHSTTSMDTTLGEAGGTAPDAVPPPELESIVASYPQVVAWLVGHSHDNRVRAIAGDGAGEPGYWEVMTSSLVDWPQQTRLVEVVDNGNDTLSIFATAVDYDTESCMERRYRRLALMEWTSGWIDDYSRAPEDTNVELVVPVPSSAADAVAAAAAGAPARIESETTLRGM